jgi:hypothetical protein
MPSGCGCEGRWKIVLMWPQWQSQVPRFEGRLRWAWTMREDVWVRRVGRLRRVRMRSRRGMVVLYVLVDVVLFFSGVKYDVLRFWVA